MAGLLGKKPFVPDPRDITFAAVKAGALPKPPKTFGHGQIYKDGEDPRLDWDMNGNGPDPTVQPGFQGAGDCVWACAAHTTREAAKVGGHTVVITGKESIADYCTTPNHRTVTADLRWVQIGDLQPGDELLAFDEEPPGGPGRGRSYRKAIVLAVVAAKAPVFDVELSTGEVIRTTAEHRWLNGNPNKSPRGWIRTDAFRTRRIRTPWIQARLGRAESRCVTRLRRVLPVWETAQSYDDGWLAGLLDGEGWLGRNVNSAGDVIRTGVGFAQNRGLVLDRALEALRELGLLTNTHVKLRPIPTSGNTLTASRCIQVAIGGIKADRLALLGKLRPTRLLDQFDPDAVGLLEARSGEAEVIDVRPAGMQEITKVMTSTGTMIVDGYPMHNCEFTGYVIGDDSTDQGTDMRTAFKQRKQTGIRDQAGARHKIAAYVSITPNNLSELLEAAYVFSAVEIGFQFQQAQYDQFASGVWDYDPNSEIIGGHAIPVFGHNSKHGTGAVSWAKHLWLTDAFVQNLIDEAWALIYPEELRNGKTERGMDLAQLEQALQQLS